MHEDLFCDTTLQLGQIHWYLLRAANALMERSNITTKTAGGFRIGNLTEFGREVANDEIHWWVFKKEQNLSELKDRTEQARAAAQQLKEDSLKLLKEVPESYAELIAILKTFAEQHMSEITRLHEYVRWLYEKDPLAPSMLFAHRVWGSTRRADRWETITATEIERENPDTIKALAEAVLGLAHHGIATRLRMEYEIGGELYEANPEGSSITVPEHRIVARTTSAARDYLQTYIVEVRDSLDNVLHEIEKFLLQNTLLASDRFWERFIRAAAKSLKVEPVLWDVKETLEMWHTKDAKAKIDAEVKFAEAVASLANANGGVLLIGITNNREIAGMLGSSSEQERRITYAQEVIARRLNAPPDLVRFLQIPMMGTQGTQVVCLAVIVGQSREPISVDVGEKRYSWPARRVAGLERMDQNALVYAKMQVHIDNFDFLEDADRFVRENGF